MAGKNPSLTLWYFKELYLLTWKAKKRSNEQAAGQNSTSSPPCTVYPSWILGLSEVSGCRRQSPGPGRGPEGQVPNPGWLQCIPSLLGLNFLKVKPLDKVVSKGGQEKSRFFPLWPSSSHTPAFSTTCSLLLIYLFVYHLSLPLGCELHTEKDPVCLFHWLFHASAPSTSLACSRLLIHAG